MFCSPTWFASIALAAFAVGQAVAQDVEWLQDFQAAKAKAKAEKKDLLIDFTGSDWCGWCIKLDEEVFSKSEFQKEAPKHFVLVKLDFPRNENLVTAEIRKQNQELAEKYQVQGYPAILLTDCEGRVYGQTGYAEGGPEKYNASLGELKKKGETFFAALAKADATKGIDRAKALDEAVSVVDAELVAQHYLPLMEEIVKLDADGKAGLKVKHEAKLQDIKDTKELDTLAQAIQTDIGPSMEAGEHDAALTKLDAICKAPKHKLHHQLALFFKGIVQVQGKQNPTAALAEFEAAKALNPDSPIGKQVTGLLPRVKKMAEEKGEKKEEGKESGK